MVSDRADDHDPQNLVPVRGSGNLTGEVILADGPSPSDEPVGWRFPVKRFPGRENQEAPAYGTLWQSLKRRWLAALVVGLALGCTATSITWVIRPADYTALALIRVESERPELLPQNHTLIDYDGSVYRRTQAALIKSPKVLDLALQMKEVQKLSIIAEKSDPRDWLDKKLLVEPIRNTELLRVVLSGQDPEELATLVNAVLQAYVDEVVVKEKKQRTARLDDLKNVCISAERRLEEQRKDLQRRAETLRTINPENAALEQKISLEEYAVFRKELIALDSELRQVAQHHGLSEVSGTAKEPANTADEAIEQALDENPEVKDLAAKVTKAENMLRKVKQTALPGNSSIKAAESEVKDAKEALKTLRSGLGEIIRKRGEAAARLQKKKAEDREKLLRDQKKDLQKDIAKAREKADTIGLAAILYEADRSKVEQTEQVIKSLLAQRERLALEGLSTAQRVTVEAEATPPRGKNWKMAVALAASVGLAFFLAGALGIASWDRRARRIRSHAEVVHGLGLRVIGSLPLQVRDSLADRPKQPANLTYQSHVWTESINGIRTVLLYEAGQHKLKAVMVTSAGPLEGKTTLASHLAISIAGAGCRTLLIDADMRRPVLHRIFERKLSSGLGEVLRGEASATEAIQATDMAGLWLLPAGTFDEVVTGLLARGQMKQLLETLRTEYDSIVIDSPPVMPVNDALLIGQHVDAVVLSVRPEQSRVPVVNAALDRLWALNIPVLGTVLNGLRSGPQHYSIQYVSSSDA